MGLTVREVLQLETFEPARLLAGRGGLDRVVERVDVIEVPDVRGWLRGGELLVTSGYAIKDDLTLQLRLIEEMARQGSAGLVLKVKRYIKRLSPQVIAMADRCDLPLIDLPPDLRHGDITTPVLANLLARQTVLLQRSADIHRKLTQVVLEGGGMDAIAQNLANAVGRAVLIEDEGLRVMAAAVPTRRRRGVRMTLERLLDLRTERVLETDRFSSMLAEAARRPGGVRVDEAAGGNAPYRVIAPVRIDDELVGYVTLVGAKETPGDLDVMAVEQAATVAALEVAKKRAVHEARHRIQADAVQDLISRNFDSPDLMVRRARSLNWDITHLDTVVVVEVDPSQRPYLSGDDPHHEGQVRAQAVRRRLLAVVREVLSGWDPQAVTAGQSDSVVILTHLPGDGEGPVAAAKRLGHEIRAQVASRVPPITVAVGVGRPHEPVVGLAASYREARQALRIGRIVFGESGVFHCADLSLYRLLFDPRRYQDLDIYYKETLAPLDEYDARHGTDFSETLRRYVENDGNVVRTAAALYVHRNTLSYRLHRIQEVLGVDLSQPETRLALLLAFKVKQLLKGSTAAGQEPGFS